MSRIQDEPVTSLTFCWQIERPDGAGIALTSHDQALPSAGATYRPEPGMVPASVTLSLGLEPTSTEIAGALSSDALTNADLTQGRWDGARVTLSAVDWQDPDAAPIHLVCGELAETSTKGAGFTAELRGNAARLDEPVCPSTSPHCRAEFGDKACRVDLAGRSLRTRIVGGSGIAFEIEDEIGEQFLFGRLRYLSGTNCGLESVILGAAGNEVRVRDLPRADVAVGTVIEVREGCDKRLQTCAERFGNAANFRGEPHLPGTDLLTRYPGA